MGAWGPGSFDNDTAMDWVYELEESSGERLLKSSLEAVAKEQCLDADTSMEALAAAEVVAALAGSPAVSLPGEVRVWLKKNKFDGKKLAALAIKAVNLVLSESELQDLWEDSDDFESWREAVRELLGRLGAGG